MSLKSTEKQEKRVSVKIIWFFLKKVHLTHAVPTFTRVKFKVKFWFYLSNNNKIFTSFYINLWFSKFDQVFSKSGT